MFDLLAMHADAAAGGDEDVAVVEGIGDVRQTGIGAWRGGVEVGGAAHGEGLVGPLGIELRLEGVEASLLLEAVVAGRAGRFLLESEVHALVGAVLLRVAGLLMRSMAMPSLSHQTESLERLNRALGLAKGTPLSERIACGRPRSRKSCSKAVTARSSRVDSSASQSRTKREA